MSDVSDPADPAKLRECARCGLPVSAGICDVPPLVFHTYSEQCIGALRLALASQAAEIAELRESKRQIDEICAGFHAKLFECSDAYSKLLQKLAAAAVLRCVKCGEQCEYIAPDGTWTCWQCRYCVTSEETKP